MFFGANFSIFDSALQHLFIILRAFSVHLSRTRKARRTMNESLGVETKTEKFASTNIPKA
jgi:hypothetical protein